MKIGIIGAGFTGLSAAYYLQKAGHEVTVFEKDEIPGGLALGFKPARHDKQSVAGGEKNWDWTLEKHYHHWFTNDKSVLDLAKEINFKVIIKRPKTSVYVDGDIYQLDSPVALLKFPKIPVIDRVRMGMILAFLRYNPFWMILEKLNTKNFLIKTMGKKGYESIWEPQLTNKFGNEAETISLAWFWARIKKRTPSLAYPEGGFLNFANHLVMEIEKKGGKIYFNTEASELSSHDGKPELKIINHKSSLRSSGQAIINQFDSVVVTLPSFLFFKMAPELPEDYVKKYSSLKGLGAINLVLRMKKTFLKDGTYWLSICDKKSPIMAVVDHSNFMDIKNYNNEHLVYLGNYLPADHPYFSMDKKNILKKYDPFLRKLNPDYRKSLIDFEAFKAPFAQPIIPVNYSKMIPPIETPLANVYLANIQQVYPWDRGTNYAVELGKKVAEQISK